MGHPKFLADPTADPDRAWKRVDDFADSAFLGGGKAVAVWFAVITFLAVVIFDSDANAISVGFWVVLAYVTVSAAHRWLLGRLVIVWINRKFKKQGWPVDRLVSELKEQKKTTKRTAERERFEARRRSKFEPVRYGETPPSTDGPAESDALGPRE